MILRISEAVAPRDTWLAVAERIGAAGVLAMGLGLFVVAASSSQSGAPPSVDLVTRCDRLAGIVGERLAAAGTPAASAEWRRQRQTAFRACIDDYAAFSRLIAHP